MKLDDGTQIRQAAYINGQWESSANAFAVYNPADQVRLADIPDCAKSQLEDAIRAADRAQPVWRVYLAAERATYLEAWHARIQDNREALAAIITAENGKPLQEARGEVDYAASFVSWYAAEARRVYGDIIPAHKQDSRVLVTKQPVGVVSAITPWNFPAAMVTRKLAPALAAGCTTVLKPAEDTPLTAIALAQLADTAGIPAGVLNIVTASESSAPSVGEVLSTDARIRKISFTGSTAVGKTLMAQAAGTVKDVSLELGGNAPFIVFESADIDAAVDGLMASKFRNTGQTCICPNRIFVQASIRYNFEQRLQQAMSALTVGDGRQGGVDIGPLINEQSLEKVETLVDDAGKKGARLVCGGQRHERGGLFYQPTLLSDMTPDMAACHREIFGPVAALYSFADEDEALRAANDTSYGLAAYAYTRDLGQAFRLQDGLDYGMVGVNSPGLSADCAPFGGMKESGIGREGGSYGIEAFLEVKYTLMAGLA